MSVAPQDQQFSPHKGGVAYSRFECEVSGCGDACGRNDQQTVAVLLSTIVHLVILLALALITNAPQRTKSGLVMQLVNANHDDAVLHLVDFVPPDPPPASESLDQEVSLTTWRSLEKIPETQFRPPAETDQMASVPELEQQVATSRSGSTSSRREKGISFFGTRAYGKKFVYVLDISGSMSAGNGRRMQRARAELVRSINELQADHFFHVVLYNDRTFNLYDNLAAPRLRPATRENKYIFARWIAGVQPSGGTMPGDALKIAGDLKPDAVFFLSDGEFMFGGESKIQSEISRFIQSFGQARPGVRQGHPLGNNSFPKSVLDNYAPGIVVHTIAFESEENRRIMETIAKSKGGQYRFIPAPNRANMPRRR